MKVWGCLTIYRPIRSCTLRRALCNISPQFMALRSLGRKVPSSSFYMTTLVRRKIRRMLMAFWRRNKAVAVPWSLQVAVDRWLKGTAGAWYRATRLAPVAPNDLPNDTTKIKSKKTESVACSDGQATRMQVLIRWYRIIVCFYISPLQVCVWFLNVCYVYATKT